MQTLPGPAVGDKCLSIRQPWAHLIIAGFKPVENRSRRTDFRGRLWVHAAARLDARSWSDVLDVPGPPVGVDEELDVTEGGLVLPALSALPLGAVVGSVEVYDCVTSDDLPDDFEDAGFAGGPWCWLLRDPRPLARPVARKGALNLWTWR